MGLDEEIVRLKQVPLFQKLDERSLEVLVFHSEVRMMPDGSTLYYEGDPSVGAIFIWSGSLELQSLVDGEMKTKTVVEENSLVDPYALISEGRRAFSAKARGDLKYMLLERSVFLKILKTYPVIAEQVRDFLADDIEATVHALNGVARRLDALD